MQSPSPSTHLAIVTGVTSGIGLAIAEHLHAAGFAIYGVARSADKLAACAVPMVGVERCDLSDLGAVEGCLSGLSLAPYRYVVLVNNAGSLDPIGRFDQLDARAVNGTMVLNGLAPLLLSATFYKNLPASCVGRVVQITSGAAHRPVAGWTSYCASKAAVHAIGNTLSLELIGTGVSCTTIHPGFVESEIARVDNQGVFHSEKADKRPAKLMWTAEKAAQVMAKAIAKRKRIFVFTGHGKLGAWLGRHWPGFTHFVLGWKLRGRDRQLEQKATGEG